MPTGEKIEFAETNKVAPFGKFLQKYKQLLDIRLKIDENENVSDSEVEIYVNNNTVEQLKLLKQFLEEVESLQIPSEENYEKLAQGLNSSLIPGIKFTHIPSLIIKLKSMINDHNLYLDSLSRQKLTRVINNYTMNSMLVVASQPVNYTQAHVSVDATTGPLKEETKNSEEDSDPNPNVSGNFVSTYKRISSNQVGRDCIGICAVGLKAFFALTQYNNTLLNNGNSELQKKILLGQNGKGILVGDTVYKTVANIRAVDPNTITNDDVLSAMLSAENDEDAAIILSALLSLSTDNAKELALSKLNAAPGMIGMYIYGITIGIDFKTLAKIMMSNIGNTIYNLLNKNIFSNNFGFNRVGDSLFKYFEEGPKSQLYKLADLGNSYTLVLSKLRKALNNRVYTKEERDNIKKTGRDIKLSMNELVVRYSNLNIPLQDKLKLIEDLKIPKGNSNYQECNYIFDFIQDYLMQKETIRLNYNDFNTIKTLAEGSEELRLLGSILSINQGVKTTSDELLAQINNITRCIYKKTKKQVDIINLHQFAFDENYRQICIDKYDKVKHTFNILDVISNSPHFLGYLQNLSEVVKGAECSFKFRSIQELSLKLSSKYTSVFNEDNVIKGIQNYIGDWMIKQWMRSKHLSFWIPKGNTIYLPNGKSFISKVDKEISLGTDWGNATFKKWFEDEVIPNLKQGKIQPNFIRENIANNAFIRDLGTDLNNKTPLKNPIINYTLPINMLPRVDQEQVIFNKYKSEFNKLAGTDLLKSEAYVYEYTTYEKGIPKLNRSKPYFIPTLFTYYAMIANNWKLGEKSLVPILEDFQNSGIIDDFHNFEAMLDKSGEKLTEDMIDIFDILGYIVSPDNPYTAYTKYIKYRDKTTKKNIILEHVDEMSDDFTDDIIEDESIIGNYSPVNTSIDSTVYPTGHIEKSRNTVRDEFELDGMKYNYNFEYDILSGQIKSLTVTNGENFTKSLSDFPIKKVEKCNVNGLEVFDTKCIQILLKSEVQKMINGC